MYPYVLVFSEGITPVEDIAQNIIKAQSDILLPPNAINVSKDYMGYMCKLKTKYYENSIILVPVKENIESIDLEVLEKVEAIILYFDSKKKNNEKSTKVYADFLKSRSMENGLILFENDNYGSGTCYGQIQKCCSPLFNIIYLNKYTGPEDADMDNQYGYKAVIQALYSMDWSNINIKKNSNKPTSTPGDFRLQKDSDTDIDGFENFLMKIQSFKSVSLTLQREEVLIFAENMATQLVKLINSDLDDDM